MPRYFFDVNDGDRITRDDTGTEADSVQSARFLAIEALPDIAQDMLPDGEFRVMSVAVRDGAGKELMIAKLTFSIEWT